MISDHGGRYKTVRTLSEQIKILQDDVAAMDEFERQIYQEMLDEYRIEGHSFAHEFVHQSIYKIQPIDIKTFLNDEYYIGETAKSLFPKWKEITADIFNGTYEEVILGGSIGIGKSSVSSIMILRMIYEISCMVDPHETYGIAKNDKISFPIISIKQSASDEILDKIAGALKGSQYFNEIFKYKYTEKDGIVFQNNIVVPPGMSRAQDAIGLNTFGGMIDESNFFRSVNAGAVKKDYMEEIYTSLKTRIKNRFMRHGRIPGLLIIASSKAGTDSFTERHIRKSVGDPSIFVTENASYEIQPEGRYSKETFRVALGGETNVPRIISDDEEDPLDQQVIKVPVE